MKRASWIVTAAMLAVMMLPAVLRAQSFSFEIPTIPYPPKIEDVNNSALVAGAPEFIVTATMYGQKQQKPKCDKPIDDCGLSDWYMVDEEGVTPNPPDVKMAKVFYYKNLDTQTTLSVEMTKDTDLGDGKWKWKATLPLGGLGTLAEGDTVTYYIVAADGRGNVSSQVPDVGAQSATCPSSPAGWNPELSTPAVSSCQYMTSYSQCNVNINGVPSPCPTTYTMNDKQGDTCGEPVGGNQSVISLPKMDILGITAAADSTYLCANYGLGAAPPDPTDAPPIEGYLLILFNPDIYDDNPADVWIKNAFAMTFAPEVVGTDPSLVRVLWEADCLTNPNTANVLDCKLISVTGTDARLQIGYNAGLKFIVKKSGTGNPHPDAYSLVGANTKLAYLIGVTGEINLSGGTLFWFTDLSAGMGFYHKNQTATAGTAPAPSAPSINNARCSVDGTSGTTSTCNKSATKPASNKCKISFAPSLDKAFVTKYKIYKNTTDTFPTGQAAVGEVTENGAASYSYTDTETQLKGQKSYYFMTSYNDANSDPAKKETPTAQSSKTNCTFEDWDPPQKPSIATAKTPSGVEKKCKLDWTMPATDSSLKSFFMTRDGVALNFTNPMGANPTETSFNWTDSDELTLGQAYSYKVTAVDLGDNTNESGAITCTPEDLKPPSQITSLLATNLPLKLGIHLEWAASTESDLGGYNSYYCKMNNSAIDCRTKESFTKMNTTLMSSISYDNESASIFTGEGDYCFYTEACDNCTTTASCPSNSGTPNCSGFPAGGADSTMYVKCLSVSAIPDPVKPAFPKNVAVTVPTDGKKCKVTWEKNYVQSTGTPFDNVITPSPIDIIGYKIMRGPEGSVPVPPNPAVGTVTISATALEFEDKNLINGTKYCYSVYAADAAGNVSESGPGGTKAEVCCTPTDTEAPSVPALTMNFTPTTCEPTWAKITDGDGSAITYKVYRCDGTSCTTANSFNLADGCTMDPGGEPMCTDYSVESGSTYKYCVTATDLAGNESSKYPAGTQPNCQVCIPAEPPTKPVTNTTAAATSDGFGAKIYWTLSEDDAGTDGGYNIYRCADANCASKTKKKSCTELLASSATVKNVGPTAPITITPEDAGDWYYGVTYQKDCTSATTESLFTGTAVYANPVTVNAPPAAACDSPSKCVVISNCDNYDSKTGCTALSEINPLEKENNVFKQVPKSGVDVLLMAQDGSFVGSSTKTDSSGLFKLQINTTENPIVAANKYKVVLKIAAADKAGIPCTSGNDNPANDCIILVKETTVKEDSTVTKVAPAALPMSGGGKAEVGNANCDAYVNMKDFNVLKAAFNSSSGDSKYKTNADFNGDGIVNMKDFNILKANFSKAFSADTSGGDPSLSFLCP